MNAIIRTLLLLPVAGAMCAQAQETPQNSWQYSIGAMYEIENVEGQAEDRDGLYEPSVYFNAAYGPWSINLVMYRKVRLITVPCRAEPISTARNLTCVIS